MASARRVRIVRFARRVLLPLRAARITASFASHGHPSAGALSKKELPPGGGLDMNVGNLQDLAPAHAPASPNNPSKSRSYGTRDASSSRGTRGFLRYKRYGQEKNSTRNAEDIGNA